MGLKHVGRIKKNKRKVIVAYRTVPNESENCIIVTTENLMADEHDTLMRTVESDSGQQANEFADVMARTQLPDGRNMLAGLHTTGKLVKVPTKEVEMTFDKSTTISLDELNKYIAQQRGVGIDDLAVTDGKNSPDRAPDKPVTASEAYSSTNVVVPDESSEIDLSVLTDEQIATKYRSDATRLFKEAKHLREEAERLSPTKKKATSTVKKKAEKAETTEVKDAEKQEQLLQDKGSVETDNE